ncbi:MAG: sensor histidine kinase, partial [Alphaproteobacteria bacterium]
DFAKITRDVVESLSGLAAERDIDLGYEGALSSLMLFGHATLLRELVVNLVDNAIHYSPGGGVVTVSLVHSGDFVTLRVEDNCPGIPPGEREKVFERFYRTLAAGSEGTGLGLAIVREIVAAHDGSVQLADREPPPGLAVIVLLPKVDPLPVTATEFPRGAAAAASAPGGSRPVS